MSQADNLAALATNVNSSGVLQPASGGTGGTTFPSPGTNGNLLTSNGTVWTSAAPPTGMVYPGAGIPNSTGSAWGTSYTTTGSGTVVALATSPSFTTPILGTPQSGNFSTGTFTWPTFNQNTTGSAGSVAAANITGTTLAAGVTGSSLTSVGTITSGTWSGSFGAVSGANLTSLNASNLSSGTVGTARLASGTANSTTYLRGDQTWATVSGGVTSLNGQTGAITNTGSNAIGSYVASISRFGGLAIFGTVAGSSLLYYNEPADQSTSMGLSGTWRYMGNTFTNNPSNNPNVPSLYVRIS